MSRGRRGELSESWDDVDEWNGSSASSSDEDQRATRRNTRLNGADGSRATPRKPVTRSSVEPELVMPASPNNGLNQKQRAQSTRFRMNERSMTSDAGDFDMGRKAKMDSRVQTPRFRMNQRSMTSDAGSLAGKAAALREEPDEDGYDESFVGYLDMAWTRILSPILAYLADIVGRALHKAKPLIAYVVFAYLIAAALIFGSGFLTNSINNALSPVCRIPGVMHFFNPSFCPIATSSGIQGPAEFDKLVQAQSAFNDVLAASSTGVNLPLDMKRSEASIRDLRHVVQYSTLPSRNELVFEFGGFIDTARQASQDLSKFNSRIGRAVDHILSTNRWTLSVIDGVNEQDASRGSLTKFFNNNLNIFAPFQPVELSRDVLLDQYLRHTGAVEEHILTLITEAQALLNVLDNLDGRLDLISGIALRDGLKAENSKEELFAYLWTKLGGNKSSVKRLENQIDLLKSVGQYRRIAWAHVTTTIVKLQSIQHQLEDLRERVAMPENVGTDQTPLEVHISSINLGIERLEEQRDASQQLQAEGYARVLDRAEAADARMIGERGL